MGADAERSNTVESDGVEKGGVDRVNPLCPLRDPAGIFFSAELVDYTPGSSDGVPFATREPRVATLPSRDGKPIWKPPPSALAARAERGIAPLDRKVDGGLWFASNCSRKASGLLECE
jgi:hypothetical protein